MSCNSISGNEITKQDLELIESKIYGSLSRAVGIEKLATMSVQEYIDSKEKIKKVLSESSYVFFYNIKIGNIKIYKTKQELENLQGVTASYLKALPESHRSLLLQGKFLSVNLNVLFFLSALIYAEKELQLL